MWKAALYSEHILEAPLRESPAHYYSESRVKCVKSQAKAILFSPGFIVLTGGRNSRIIVQIMKREMARCSAVYDTPMKLSKLIRIRIAFNHILLEFIYHDYDCMRRLVTQHLSFGACMNSSLQAISKDECTPRSC
jgi:hypothetical protein